MNSLYGFVDVPSYVAAFTPRHLPDDVWAQIGPAVRAAAVVGLGSPSTAQRSLSVLAAFGAWALRQGHTVDAALLANAALIDQYVESQAGGMADSSRATRRSILRRVAGRIDPAPVSAPEAIRYQGLRPPYTAGEVARYFQLAQAQASQARWFATHAALALGLGCGIDRVDLAWIRGVDLDVAPDGAVQVTVAGGSRPRTVTALEDYAPLLQECAEHAGPSLLIGGAILGQSSRAATVLTRLAADKTLEPVQQSRLRSTWVVRHLDLGTPLSVLLAAAGMRSGRSLEHLLPHTAPVDEARARLLLRGGPR